MNLHARIWFVILTAPVLCAAGCSDTQAPAMTQPMVQAKDTAPSSEAPVDPASRSTPPADLATDDVVAPSSTPTEGEASAASLPAKPQAEPPAPSGTPDRLRDISFDDLKFDINKGDPFQRSLLTDKIEALNGKPVRIRGYILPSFQQTGLTQFVLVRDNLSCCFGPGAAIYDCVIVEMKPGHSTDYSLYPVAVDGTFTIHEMLDPEGKAVAIYHLDGEQVR